MIGPQPADPGDDGRDPVGSLAGGHVRTEVDERVTARIALAVPGPPPADGDLELDHRLEPVDVGTFEQASLDQAHGPGRIASRLGRVRVFARLTVAWTPRHRAHRSPRSPSSTASGPPSPPTFRPTWPTSSGWSTSTAGRTRPRA